MLHRFRAHISAASALFAIVPLVAFLLVRNDSARDRIRWTLAHLVTLFGSLAVTFVLIELLFRLGVFPQSAVVSFEVEPLYKLWWFISGPVANAFTSGESYTPTSGIGRLACRVRRPTV